MTETRTRPPQTKGACAICGVRYAKAGMTPRDGLRKAEDGAKALKDASDDAILDAMAADPILIERPLVETEKGVRLGRPPEKVKEIL